MGKCRAAARPRSKPAATAQKSGGDALLWGQMLFCTLVLLAALAARMEGLPLYPELRRAFAQAMQPEQDFLLSAERHFSKFTEKAAAAFAQAMPSTPETARQPHRKPQLPAYAREESYTPDFALQFPLPGGSCTKTSGYGWRADPMGGGGTDFQRSGRRHRYAGTGRRRRRGARCGQTCQLRQLPARAACGRRRNTLCSHAISLR